MQLSEYNSRFEALGIKVATVTYDDQRDSQAFHKRHKLPYPILKDEGSELIISLGILNKAPVPGDRFYGIPYPGMFLVDRDGIIRAKFAEEGYKVRPNFNGVLAAAAELAKAAD